MLNIDDVLPELELINNSKSRGDGINIILDDVRKEEEKLAAKKHLFSVLSLAFNIQDLFLSSGLEEKDIDCITFAEHEYVNDNYCLCITIEPAESGDLLKVNKLEQDINDLMFILGDPKFYFFSDSASDQIDDYEYFELPNKFNEISTSFIRLCLNKELLDIYNKADFKINLENSLNQDLPKKVKTIKI